MSLGVGRVDMDLFNSAGGIRGSKRSVFEGGPRAPVAARWPGIPPNDAVTDQATYFRDLSPTPNKVIGADVLEWLDGNSLEVTVHGAGTLADRKIVWG